ncbi:uncharacterized protein LOC135144459 [Zophobas morio]|uniref:uncharacterized protein LOC135144459 n=1 Tax=Zophobas morio TaxID=2755281 RepID=UPI003082A6D2
MYSPLLNSLSDLLVFDTSTALTTLQKGDSTLSIHVDARAEEEPVIWFMTASSASVVRSLEFAERKDLLSEKFRDTFVSEVMCPARDTFERLLHLGADCCLGMMFPASCSWHRNYNELSALTGSFFRALDGRLPRFEQQLLSLEVFRDVIEDLWVVAPPLDLEPASVLHANFLVCALKDMLCCRFMLCFHVGLAYTRVRTDKLFERGGDYMSCHRLLHHLGQLAYLSFRAPQLSCGSGGKDLPSSCLELCLLRGDFGVSGSWDCFKGYSDVISAFVYHPLGIPRIAKVLLQWGQHAALLDFLTLWVDKNEATVFMLSLCHLASEQYQQAQTLFVSVTSCFDEQGRLPPESPLNHVFVVFFENEEELTLSRYLKVCFDYFKKGKVIIITLLTRLLPESGTTKQQFAQALEICRAAKLSGCFHEEFWAKSFFKTALETNSHEEAFVVLTLASKELVLSPMLSEMAATFICDLWGKSCGAELKHFILSAPHLFDTILKSWRTSLHVLLEKFEEFVYSHYLLRMDYKTAALEMLRHEESLEKNSPSSLSDRQRLHERLKALSLCMNALHQLEDQEQWLYDSDKHVLVSLEKLQRKYYLLLAKSHLLQQDYHIPDLEGAGFQATFSLLEHFGLYDEAVALARWVGSPDYNAPDLPLSSLFQTLASDCIRISFTSKKKLDDRDLFWLNHNQITDEDGKELIIHDPSARAWALLKSYLQRLDSPDTNYFYHSIVLSRLFTENHPAETWLIEAFKALFIKLEKKVCLFSVSFAPAEAQSLRGTYTYTLRLWLCRRCL